MKSLARSGVGCFGSFWLVLICDRRLLRVKSLVLPPEVAAGKESRNDASGVVPKLFHRRAFVLQSKHEYGALRPPSPCLLDTVLRSHSFQAMNLANAVNLPRRPKRFKAVFDNTFHGLDGWS